MTHAEAVQAAERQVVEAVLARRIAERRANWHAADPEIAEPADALLALRAATCQECGGTGEITVASTRGGYATDDIRCPAGCERGKRRTT